MKMRKSSFFWAIAILITFAACQPSVKVNENDPDNLRLNSLLTLEEGDNLIVLQDFTVDVSAIDSLTASSDGVNVVMDTDKVTASVKMQAEADHFFDIKIWKKGVAYSIPCRKSDKIRYTFQFDPKGKTYGRVQIKGQMNDWAPGNTPDLQLNNNGKYAIDLMVSPGKYQYQIVLDGNAQPDANNPEKVDNGSGSFNSVFDVPGKSDMFPRLYTESFAGNSFVLETRNDIEKVFVFWQNILLPQDMVIQEEGRIRITIPLNANKMLRSYVRVWAANAAGSSNDVLVPLNKGKVLKEGSQITKDDFHAQIMYFMLVDRFKNGNTANDNPLNRPDVNPKVDYWGGDLAGIQQKVEDGYFKSLGVNTLWISPVSQNPDQPYGYYKDKNTKFSGYHGYWPISSSQVDNRFGSNQDFKTLISKSHDNGINVLLDYVANHVHEEHPLYKKHPEYATNLYLPDGSMNVEKWDEQRLTTWFDTFMPSLDFANPEVVDLMTDSALYWIKEFGLDGFRHDACKHIELEFWRALSLKLKKAYPDKQFYQIGETYGSPGLISSYLTTGMIDGQFDFNLYDMANNTFAGMGGADLKKVSQIMKTSLNVYGMHHLMGNISGNHDKPRFMAYASGDLKPGEDTKAAGWFREIGISDSTAYDKMFLFHTFNMTIPGIPVIYYGDELGFTGANDPDCRKMMRFDGWNNREQILRDKVATITKFRNSNPLMIYGDFIELLNDETTWVYARKYFDKSAIIFINNSPETKTIVVDVPTNMNAEVKNSMFGNKTVIEKQKMSVTLPPYSADVLK